MKYFEAENIRKKFQDMEVDFSFSAEKGSFTCLTGPSGSGKSTALRIIAGLEKSSAEIFLNGTKISGKNPGERNIGFVFQQSTLFMNMNVEKNIAFGLKCRGVKKEEQKKIVSELLEKTGLSGFEKRSCGSLSGGEEQRVSLARTLAVKPDLILLDEPFSALDKERRESLGKLLKKLQETEKLTFIMVTHDMEEAEKLSDYIVRIENGKKTFEGPSSQFFKKDIH